MSELIFRIKADYEQAIKCREELKKVEQQLKAVDQNTSPKEIERLTKRYAELTSYWENGMSRIGKTVHYAHEAFQKIASSIKNANEEIGASEGANKNIYSTLTNRLRLEEKITEQVTKQKEEAEKQLEKSIEGYNKNANVYNKWQEKFGQKYRGKAEEYWDEADRQQVEQGRATLEKWEKDIEDKRTKLDVFNSILEESQKRTEEYKEKLGNLDLPKLDLKDNIIDLEQQVNAGVDKIKELRENMKSLNDELNERQDFQGAKDKMSSIYGDIENKKKEIESLQQAIDGFSLTDKIQQQQSLESLAEFVTEKIVREEEAIERLTKKQEGLNEQSALYKQIQDEIDFHTEEKERYSQQQERINVAIEKSKQLIDDETKAQEERQQKVKSLSAEVEVLNEKYQRQQDIVNNTDANQEAISSIREEMKKTQEQIDDTKDSTNALKDVLYQVVDVYNDKVNKENEAYKGWAYTDNNNRATKVFLNEDDYNRSNELHGRADELEGLLRKDDLPIEDLQRYQEELKKIQEELSVLDDKARETANTLGADFAQKVAQVTERAYEANKAVKEQAAAYEELERQLNTMKELLSFQERNNASAEQINTTKAAVDKLTESLNTAKDKLSEAKQEQVDAQKELSGLSGKLDMLQSSMVKAVGGAENFNQILSMMPASIRGVVTGIASMRNAAMAFLATPVGVTIMAIAAALYAVKKALDVVFLWFNKSAEGQMAYAKIAGYLQGVLTRLEEIFVKLGGTIFNVTKNIVKYIAQPKKAFKAVMDFIGDQIKNRLKGFVDAFTGFGETIANVFVDLWESVKSGKLDFSETQKSAKKVLNGILAIGTGVNNVTDKIGDAVDATVQWFEKTHEVAKESSKIAEEERKLGLEMESNRKKTLELQKSMAELQATMRNTNLSKEERQKALEEYKKQLQQQTQIQKDFAEKRRDLQQRKMDLDDPDTLEEMQELAKYQNDVLAAEVAQQRALTSLQRVTNSINKKSRGGGKTKEQLQEEYNLLLNDQAQKQAKQIRENGYVIEQARINAMEESTEKTIAQMRLDYKKELDAAVEYEDNLKKEKLKLARDRFNKDPKNKKKAFDATSVDMSMTEQEKQVSKSKVSDAQNKYKQRIDSLLKPYETYAEKRERKERDFKTLSDFVANEILEKTRRQGELYEVISGQREGDIETAKKEVKEIDNQISLLEEKGRIIAANKNLQDEELQAMRDYLKEYGTFQQQRQVIAEEFADKIRIAQAEGNQGKVLMLQEQQKKAEADVEYKAIEQKIDWYSVFDNMGLVMKGALEEQLNMLREFVKSPKFQELQPEQKQTVVNAMSNIRQSIGLVDDLGFRDLAAAVQEYQNSLREQREAEDNARKVELEYGEKLREAQEKLKNIDPNDKTSYDAANKEVMTFREKIVAANIALNNANRNVKSSGQNLATITKDVTQPVSEITTFLQASGIPALGQLFSAFDQLKGGIEGLKALKEIKGEDIAKAGKELADKTKDAADKGSKAIEKAGPKLAETLGKGGFIAQIVSAVLTILDILKDGIGTLISGILDSIFNAIAGILKNLLSGDFAVQIVSSIGDGLKNILNAVTFGGFSSWFGIGGADYSDYEEAKVKYDQLLDVWDMLIDKKKQYLNESWGVEAQRAGEEALELIKAEREQTRILAEILLGSGASMGSSSIAYRMWEGSYFSNGSDNIGLLNNGRLSSTQDEVNWSDVNKAIERGLRNAGLGNVKFENMSDLLNMTSEQLEWIMKNYTGLWSHMDGDFKDLLQKTMKLGEEEANVAEDIRERILGTSKDSFVDSLLNPLYDFKASTSEITKAVSDNFAKMWNNMILNNNVKAKYQKQLEDLYEEWYNLYQSGNTIDEAEKKRIQNAIKDLEAQMTGERDRLKQEGWLLNDSTASDQSATSKSIQNITYEQGDDLVGRITAGQILWEHSLEQQTLLNAKVDQLFGGSEPIRNIAADSRDILAGMAIDLSQIKDGVMDTIVPRIRNIDSEIVKVRKAVEAQ